MLFNNQKSPYEQELHKIHLKTKRAPSTKVQVEIQTLAAGDYNLYEQLLNDYCERYGMPPEMKVNAGYVYLMKAEGFHSILGWLIGRYKIGLSNNPQRRHVELNGQQAPCPISLVRYIQVESMAITEAQLHKKFAAQRRHGEWFDLFQWELLAVHLAYDKEARDFKRSRSAVLPPLKQLAIASGGFIAVVLLTSFVVSSFSQSPPEVQNADIQEEVR